MATRTAATPVAMIRVRNAVAAGRRLVGRSSLATRLVFFAVALVGVTAMLIGTLSYTRARHALETKARARLVLVAHDVAAHVRRELEDRAADITNWAHLEVMRALLYQDVDKELVQFLEQALRGRPAYRALVCLDREGRRVAGAGDVDALGPRGDGGRLRVSLASRSGRPLVQLEAAAFNPERPGAVIGTVAALLDPGPILDAIDRAQGAASGRVALTLRSGDVVLAADARPASDDPVLGAVAPVGSLAGTDGPELEVGVAEPVAAAFAEVTALRATLFETGLLVVMLGAVLAALLAWRLATPIRQLTATVREIGERGEPVVQASFPQVGGEVGVLASAFKTMMESLAAAQREALARSRLVLLGEIAANVAHEVRTPLSVLKTAVQLLARPAMSADDQRELALTAAAEVDRLNVVVTGLVDLARPEPVRYAPEAVGPMVDRAVALCRPLAAKSAVDLVRRGTHDGLLVHASRDRLHQVLLNLLQNALQAMRGPGTVTVTTRAEARAVVVEVDDTGPGFAPDVLPRVFSPFVTTRPDGTGLGLAIVKRIVEEHGGIVGAENRPEGGARVWLRLPLRGQVA